MHVHVAVDQATTKFGPLLTCHLGSCYWLQYLWMSCFLNLISVTSISLPFFTFNSDRRGTFRHGTLFGRGRNFEPNAGEIQKKQATSLQLRTTVSTSINSTTHFLDGSKCTLHVLRTHTANTFQKKRTFLHLSSQSKKIKHPLDDTGILR